ncbi:hypothetical protein BGZ73_008813 [Actinomortierella ambigua]|nr:hypothetical protein BGZ73_008813 [Actinomortierella ambigua]
MDFFKSSWETLNNPDRVKELAQNAVNDIRAGWNAMTEHQAVQDIVRPALANIKSSWHAANLSERAADMTHHAMNDMQAGWSAISKHQSVQDMVRPAISNLESAWQAAKIHERVANVSLPTMEDVKSGWDALPYSVKGAVIGVTAVHATGLVVGAVGFGQTGISASTGAALIMACYGGFVTKGSVCAVAQSIGAVGIPVTTYILAGALGGLVGASIQNSMEKEKRQKDSTVDLLEVD